MNVQIFFIFGLISFILEIWGPFVKSESKGFMFSLKNVEGMYSNVNSKISRYLASKDNDGDSMIIHGNSSYLKYYYMNIYVGTPPQRQAVIIDTGSQITAVPCQPHCRECGKHLNSYYDMRLSNTSGLLTCGSKYCLNRCNNDAQCSFSNVRS